MIDDILLFFEYLEGDVKFRLVEEKEDLLREAIFDLRFIIWECFILTKKAEKGFVNKRNKEVDVKEKLKILWYKWRVNNSLVF